MSDEMSLCVNGQSRVPPRFRFHPTEEELLHCYLRKKVAYEKIDLDVIREVDLNKLEPWDIQENCKIGSTPQNDWYFFSHNDNRYPIGNIRKRVTAAGFWKAIGRDKVIYSNSRRIGMRKTLVFYRRRAPHGQKSEWIMHEYRLDDSTDAPNIINAGDSSTCVVCRVFKKRNYLKTSQESSSSPTTTTCKQENPDEKLEYFTNPGFARLPGQENPSPQPENNLQNITETGPSSSDWVAMNRLVARQLKGLPNYTRRLICRSRFCRKHFR